MINEVNKVYKDIFTTDKRYIILMGGRGAGRSTVASQLLTARLFSNEYMRAAIMRFVSNDIRSSAYAEIKDRIEFAGELESLDTDSQNAMVFKRGMNSIHAHGFRKSQSERKAKLKSLANYNLAWIEEADEIPEADFMQLDDTLRTTLAPVHILMTLNPPARNHWIIKRFFDLQPVEGLDDFYIPIVKDPDVLFINTDYTVNAKNIAEKSIQRYEKYKETDPAHYWQMIRGYVPEVVRGRVYGGWKKVNAVPEHARLLCYGLDFGYSPDPTAIVGIYLADNTYYIDEICYKTDLFNRDTAKILKDLPPAMVYADLAGKQNIAELRAEGIRIVGAEKGAGSIEFGVKKIQGLNIAYTARSVHLEKEYENYAYKVAKDGEQTGEINQSCPDHLLDAMRYGIVSVVKPKTEPTFIAL